MAELVYAPVLGTGGAIHGGSSPLLPTMKKIIITSDNSGIRLDKFLASSFAKASENREEFFSYTRGDIVRNIKSGKILVSGEKVKPSYLLKKGDEVVVDLKKEGRLIPNDDIRLSIVFQNDDFIVVNKTAGLKVHPSTFEENGTLVNGIIAKFPEITDVNDGSAGSEFRPGIVHRLDKDTSGLMVVARNQKAFEELKGLFQERKVHKKYSAIVFGKLVPKEGVIDKPLAKAESYKKQIIAHRKTKTKIRNAITEFKVIKEYDNASLIEAVPKTGRTHQIRVHLASIGHPIVGDKTYGFGKKSDFWMVGRQFLHAQELIFDFGKKRYNFNAELPEDFKDFLAGIGG